ncbi:hypothetical protein F4779DRAFT_595391 [Xylariaceae sp. FL0662B]|nr:hypothetical protein F4779DRAFT_595391 [Xylariaceae sp. FL0662B]
MSAFYGLNLSTPLEDLIPPPTVVNDTHKVYSIAVASIVLGIITTLIVFVRLGTRLTTKTLGPDDYAIIPATVLYLAWIALAGYMNLNAGIGKPLWEITVSEYGKWYQCIIAALFLYPAMSASVRISILLLYLRMFAKGNPPRAVLLYILLTLQGIYVVIFSILPAFVCRPVDNVKYPLEHTTYCDDIYYAHMQTGLFSVSLGYDIILLIVPILWVFKLKLPIRKRIGLVIIFALGAGSSIAAAYKLAIQIMETWNHMPRSLEWYNYLLSRFVPTQFETYGETFWVPSVVEPTVAMIGTSLPALYQLSKQASQKLSSNKVSLESSELSGGGKAKGIKVRFSGRARGLGGGFHSMNDSDIELREAAA